MPISKTITVGGKNVTVTELTMQQIFDLSDAEETNGVGQVGGLLAATTRDLDQAAIMALAPSDINDLVDGVLEVNSDFLAQARRLGMESLAASLEKLIRSLFTLPFLS